MGTIIFFLILLWTFLCHCFTYKGVSSQNSYLKQPVDILHPERQNTWSGAFLTSWRCLGLLSAQVGLGTAGPHSLQEDAPSADWFAKVSKPCSSWQSPAWAKNSQHIQKSRQYYSVVPPYCSLMSHLLFWPLLLTEQLSSVICPWWCNQSEFCLQIGSNRWHKAGKRTICH